MKACRAAKLFLCMAVSLGCATRSPGSETGGIDSGGGDAFVCGGFFEEKKVYLADTYELIQEGAFAHLPRLAPAEFMELFAKNLDSRQPGLGKAVQRRFKELIFVESKKSLPDLEDDFLPTLLPNKCKKKQLGIQDLRAKRVLFDSRLFHGLTHLEQALFYLHETFLSLRGRPGDTTELRKDVYYLLNQPEFRRFLVKTLLKNQYLPRFSHAVISSVAYFTALNFIAFHVVPESEATSFRELLKKPLTLDGSERALSPVASMLRMQIPGFPRKVNSRLLRMHVPKSKNIWDLSIKIYADIENEVAWTSVAKLRESLFTPRSDDPITPADGLSVQEQIARVTKHFGDELVSAKVIGVNDKAKLQRQMKDYLRLVNEISKHPPGLPKR